MRGASVLASTSSPCTSSAQFSCHSFSLDSRRNSRKISVVSRRNNKKSIDERGRSHTDVAVLRKRVRVPKTLAEADSSNGGFSSTALADSSQYGSTSPDESTGRRRSLKRLPGTIKRSTADVAAEAVAAQRAMNAPSYDARALAAMYSNKPTQVLLRFLKISTSLGSVALSILLDKQNGSLDKNMRQRAVQLRKALTELGPTFVKLGQALSTRPDLCPPAYLDELAVLQDAIPTFPDAEAFSLIESEIGRPLDSLFEKISPSPIAAASLGQVYQARLKGTSELVAVKVQRPSIVESIGLDFYLLRNLFSLVDEYVDIITTSLVNLLDEFAMRVYQELNYVQEARNAIRFKELYGQQGDIVVPMPVWEITSSKVLCMEWIEGVKLSDAAEMKNQNLNVLQLVDVGIQCSLRQLLEYGFFHADPHPGNLLATPDGKLAFLDFGMMSETPPSARYAIIGHVVHLVNRDYEAMARDYYALDFLEPEVDVSPIVPALRNFFDDVLQASVSELNFKTIVDGLGNVLYQYPFNVPAYYALILRSLTVLEGLALYTDPNFKVLAAAYPYMAKRLLTDSNPYLRDGLIELLFKDGTFRWNRLENLLTQGKKDRDYDAGEALQPVLSLLVSQDGLPLRKLVESECVRVTEALIIGGMIEGVESVRHANDPERNSFSLSPAPFAPLILPSFSFLLPPSPSGRVRLGNLKDEEIEDMLELRKVVLQCWSLLQSSSGFDPAILTPIVQIMQQVPIQRMGSNIAGGLMQRMAARFLQVILRPPPSAASRAGV